MESEKLMPLTAQSLCEAIGFYVFNNQIKNDTPVLITLEEPSIGARWYTTISACHVGFDWEHGQLRIEPAEKLVRIGNNLQDEKPMQEWRGEVFCPRCISSVKPKDKFCRLCGQKLGKAVSADDHK